MEASPTAVERVVARVRRHPAVSILALAGGVVIGLASFTDAARDLLGLLPDPSVEGRWHTDPMVSPFAASDTFHLELHLQGAEGRVLGSVVRVSAAGAYRLEEALVEGRLDGRLLSFQIPGASYLGSELVSYRDFYEGSVAGDSIVLNVRSDRPWPFPPLTFVARRTP